MKKLLPFVVIIVLAGCGKKEWTKESVSKRCLKGLQEKNSVNKLLNDEKKETICDCIAGKMIANYTSEAEANKDTRGAAEIGKDCTISVMKGE